jgi:hypothetical protein
MSERRTDPSGDKQYIGKFGDICAPYKDHWSREINIIGRRIWEEETEEEEEVRWKSLVRRV